MLTYSGISAGPLLGGWLTTAYGWRTVFYINVPVGLLALWLSYRFVPDRPPLARARGFDVPGALLFLIGLIGLMLALDQGHAWGWLSLPIVSLVFVAALALTGFVFWEGRTADPMLSLALFGNRVFAAAGVSATLNFMTLSGLLFLLPFYLIGERGLSAERAGWVLAALPLAMAVVAPLSGWLADRIGNNLPAIVGMIVLAFGTLLLTCLGPGTPLPQVAWKLAVAGLGVGIFLSPNNSALMGAAPREQQGVASGVRATARNVGNVLGVGTVGAVFNSVLAHHAFGQGMFPAFHAGIVYLLAMAVIGAMASAVRARSGIRSNWLQRLSRKSS